MRDERDSIGSPSAPRVLRLTRDREHRLRKKVTKRRTNTTSSSENPAGLWEGIVWWEGPVVDPRWKEGGGIEAFRTATGRAASTLLGPQSPNSSPVPSTLP